MVKKSKRNVRKSRRRLKFKKSVKNGGMSPSHVTITPNAK